MLYYFFAMSLLFAGAIIILVPAIKGKLSKGSAKSRLITNLCLFSLVCLGTLAFPLVGFAAGTTQSATSSGGDLSSGLGYLAMAIATGMSTVSAGIATGNAASAAIGAISEDPKLFGKSLILVVLAEGISIFGILVSLLIFTKI